MKSKLMTSTIYIISYMLFFLNPHWRGDDIFSIDFVAVESMEWLREREREKH